jgi:hypothetical protein
MARFLLILLSIITVGLVSSIYSATFQTVVEIFFSNEFKEVTGYFINTLWGVALMSILCSILPWKFDKTGKVLFWLSIIIWLITAAFNYRFSYFPAKWYEIGFSIATTFWFRYRILRYSFNITCSRITMKVLDKSDIDFTKHSLIYLLVYAAFHFIMYTIFIYSFFYVLNLPWWGVLIVSFLGVIIIQPFIYAGRRLSDWLNEKYSPHPSFVRITKDISIASTLIILVPLAIKAFVAPNDFGFFMSGALYLALFNVIRLLGVSLWSFNTSFQSAFHTAKAQNKTIFTFQPLGGEDKTQYEIQNMQIAELKHSDELNS